MTQVLSWFLLHIPYNITVIIKFQDGPPKSPHSSRSIKRGGHTRFFQRHDPEFMYVISTYIPSART